MSDEVRTSTDYPETYFIYNETADAYVVLLKEWKLEFLGEGRRRTDLVRWDAYVTEDWWDHKATNNPNLNRFPIHYNVIGANNLIEQNPGYGGN